MDGGMKTNKGELRARRSEGETRNRERTGWRESKNFAEDVTRLEAIQFVVTIAFYAITSNLHSTSATHDNINASRIYPVFF